MKTFIVMELFLYICSSGIMAQTADTRTIPAEYTNQHNKLAIYPKGQKQEMQYPELLKMHIGNKLKFVLTGNQKPDSIITWDSNENQWFVYYTSTYTYNANGNKTLDIAYSRNISTNQRDTLWKEEYSYDANGNNTTYVYYTRKDYNHPLIAWKKDKYTYDANGNVTLDSIYGWDEKTNQLVNYRKGEYYYNGNGNIDSVIQYSLYPNISRWVISNKDEYYYDAYGNITLIINYYMHFVYELNSVSRQWEIYNKDVITYDTQRSITLDSNFYWDTPNSLILSISKSNYTYDDDENKILEIDYSWNASQWIVTDKKSFYYSGQTPTLIPKIPENQIRVYPNPTRDLIVFDLSNVSGSAIVELYDMEGKKISEQKLTENNQISVGNLPKGLYLFRIRDNGKKYAGKILVE